MATKKKVRKKAARAKSRVSTRAALGPDVDVAEATRAPILDIPKLVTLGKRMAPRVPKKPDAVARAGRTFADEWERLAEQWQSMPKKVKADQRPLDNALDNAWSGFVGRIEAWTRIDSPNAAVAQEILDLHFPNRLDFTRAEHTVQWAESEKRIRQFDERETKRVVTLLAGAEFLTALRKAHVAFGDVLGVTGAQPTEDEQAPDLQAQFFAARNALVAYTTQVAAAHNASEDKATRKALRALLAPVDAARAVSRAGVSAKPAEPAGGGAGGMGAGGTGEE